MRSLNRPHDTSACSHLQKTLEDKHEPQTKKSVKTGTWIESTMGRENKIKLGNGME
jgi:hypothetical protein